MSPNAEDGSLSDFVALYRGRTVSEAELVAVSAEPRLVGRFFAELLGENEKSETSGEKARTATLELLRSEPGTD
jgi:hypothetical protein